jgi:predicted MPP superfamily phosphohydrolase
VTTASFISRFALVLAAWMVTHVYLGWRLLLPVRGRKRLVLLLVGVLVAVVPPFTLLIERQGLEFPMKDALRWGGFAGVGFSAILGLWFLSIDVLRLLRWVGRRATGRISAVPSDPARRAFLRNSMNLGVVAAAGGYAGIGASTAQDTPGVQEVTIPISELHPDLEGFRIVQITDLHAGATIHREYIERVAKAASALAPDLFAVTGDLVDGQVAAERDTVAPLRDLRAPHGVFFVTGNHEYYWDVRGWLTEVRSWGWQPLLNEHRVIERGKGRLLLGGVTDYRSSRYVAEHVSDPAAARAGAPRADVSVLLAHQPRSIFAASKAGWDVQISGHTHGGQFFPVNLLVHLVEPYVSGLHRHESTWIYVSRGTGYWGPPNRLGVPKEITVLTLTRAS